MTSPFGKYSSVVATVVAVAIIAAALFMHATGHPDPFVDNLGFGAFGAVFGASASSALTNGSVGRDLTALHARLDQATIVPASNPGGEVPS